MYKFQSKVRFSEIDENKKLSIASVVDYFQDTSTMQSEELGAGMDYLQSLGQVWVMSYWQIAVDRYPELNERISVGTFPYDFKSFMGLRNFFLEDASGEMVIKANSIWTLMDLNAGRPVKPSADMLSKYQLEPKLDMEYAARKIFPEGDAERMPEFLVTRQHLDSNHHVNNGQYIHMAMEYLPEGFEVRQMRAEYRKSALLHDRMIPEVYKQDDVVWVSLNHEEGQPFTIIEFKR